MASLTDAESQTTSYIYSVRGEKLTETYPDHSGGNPGDSTYGIVTFVYDNAGRLLRKQDQLGDTCTFNNDLAGRMTQRDYRTKVNSPSDTIADSDAFTFDRVGHMLTAVSGRYSNTVSYTYDLVGRKATEAITTNGQTYTIGTEYNSRGELVKYTYPDSSIQERTYHATGALNLLKLDGNTVSTRTYDQWHSAYSYPWSDARAADQQDWFSISPECDDRCERQHDVDSGELKRSGSEYRSQSSLGL